MSVQPSILSLSTERSGNICIAIQGGDLNLVNSTNLRGYHVTLGERSWKGSHWYHDKITLHVASSIPRLCLAPVGLLDNLKFQVYGISFGPCEDGSRYSLCGPRQLPLVGPSPKPTSNAVIGGSGRYLSRSCVLCYISTSSKTVLSVFQFQGVSKIALAAWCKDGFRFPRSSRCVGHPHPCLRPGQLSLQPKALVHAQTSHHHRVPFLGNRMQEHRCSTSYSTRPFAKSSSCRPRQQVNTGHQYPRTLHDRFVRNVRRRAGYSARRWRTWNTNVYDDMGPRLAGRSI